jgi:hypothetical protein
MPLTKSEGSHAAPTSKVPDVIDGVLELPPTASVHAKFFGTLYERTDAHCILRAMVSWDRVRLHCQVHIWCECLCLLTASSELDIEHVIKEYNPSPNDTLAAMMDATQSRRSISQNPLGPWDTILRRARDEEE